MSVCHCLAPAPRRAALVAALLIALTAACRAEPPATSPPAAPRDGTDVFAGGAMANLAYITGAEWGKSETVPVTGQPFSIALRLTTTKRPPNEWDADAGIRSKAAVAQGDVLLLSFYVRAVKGQAETGEAHTTVDFEVGAPPWSKSISEGVGIPSQWKRIEIPFVARYDTPADGALLGFRMGYNPQSFEIGGLTLTNYGKSKTVAELPRTRSDYAGQEDDAPWRKAALARIEKIRKGDMIVRVVDAAGKPARGATVSVRMTRHAFLFGSEVAADEIVATGADADRYRALVKSLYNAAPVENHLKWPLWEGGDRPDGTKTVDWLAANRIAALQGGPLIWGGWGNLPDDMKAKQNDKAALEARVSAHIAEIVPLYRGKIAEWEVVNEPFAQNDLWRIVGKDKIAAAFVQTHALDPGTRLMLNDYPPLDGAALTTNPHLMDFEANIKALIAAHAPLGEIGFQCHFGSNIIPPARVLSGLDHFARFGVPIAVTEFDMDTADEDLQKRYMRDFMTAAFSHSAVNEIIQWGFWEGKHWLPNAALYRKDWTIKPNGQAWLDLVKRDWWTNADGATGADGSYRTRGFYGDYEITVTGADGVRRTVLARLEKGKAGLVSVRL